MKKVFYSIYGLFSYGIFLIVYVYFIFWENNMLVPTGIDLGEDTPIGLALFINLLLMSLFFVPHSMMARSSFKRWWTQIVPEPLERSTYVLISSMLMGLWVYYWRPIPIVIYDLTDSWWGTSLQILSLFGFALTVFSTFLINHFELFGLKQVFIALLNKKEMGYQFVTPLLYKWVRHPLYFSFMVAFWCNSLFTLGHLLMALFATAYIQIGIKYEENDLQSLFGITYREYSENTPKLIPSLVQSGTLYFLGLLGVISLVIGYFLGALA